MIKRSLSGRREFLPEEPNKEKAEKQGQILSYLETLERVIDGHTTRLHRLYVKLQPVMESPPADHEASSEIEPTKMSKVADRLQTLISNLQADTELVDEIIGRVQL